MKKQNNLASTSDSGLRSECLSFTEVIAQSISNIAPSATPAFTIPMVFALAGNGTWLTYAFATIAVILIGHHINQFAKRSSSPGALYTYVGSGMGGRAGFLSGWSLIIAYILTACATLGGFENYLNVVVGYLGISVPSIVAFAIAALGASFMVYRDVKVSAKMMLALEGLSLAVIFILGAVVLGKHGLNIDMAQVSLDGVSFDSLRLGLVLAFFSFVGFESAASLGDEAKNPLKNIPKSVIISAVFVGIIFIVFSYIEVMGFMGSEIPLNESPAPLTYLAEQSGFGFIGIIISVGATISFFSCTVACMTASARIILSMAQDKLMHDSLAKTHEKHNTPYGAVKIIGAAIFIIPTALALFGTNGMDIFSWLGTIATLGFLFSYAMVVISAPMYLAKIKELKVTNVITSVFTMLVLLIPIVGSVYPLPAYPFNLFPFIFLAWLAIGGVWYSIKNNERESLDEELNQGIAVDMKN